MADPQEVIASLKTGHQAIVNCIAEIQPLLRSYLSAKPKLREFHKTLLAHFNLQNAALADRLSAHYVDNREALKMVEFLTVDLKDIKVRYLLFFEQHSGELPDINARSFPKDFMSFAGLLLARIKMEEDYLIPLISKLPHM